MAFDILSRRNKDREKYGDRVPPGQKVVEDWPVLTYGGAPRVELKDWELRISERLQFTPKLPDVNGHVFLKVVHDIAHLHLNRIAI